MALIAFDKKLKSLYEAAYTIDNDRQALEMDQLHWLKKQRDKCDTELCMAEAYKNRIFFLGQKIEANKILNDQPLAKSEYAEVCNGVASLASDKKLQDYKIIGIEESIIPDSVKKILVSNERQEKVCSKEGFCEVNEIYNIKISNSARAKKYIKYYIPGTCSSAKIYPIDYLALNDKNYSGRVSVDDPSDALASSAWGSDEFPIYYKQRNYIITGGADEPRVVSLIQPDAQILPLCLLAKSSVELVVAEDNDKNIDNDKKTDKETDKELCAGVASGLIKPQDWHTPDQAEPAELANMAEARGRYNISLLLQPIKSKANEPQQAFVRFSQDSGAGCGSHHEWVRRTFIDNNVKKINFEDKLFANKEARKVSVYLHNENYYIGFFQGFGSANLYHYTNDELTKICEFEEKVIFKSSRFF